MTNRDNDTRKQELKNKVERLAETVQEIEPRNEEEAIFAVERMLYMANIHALKEFLIDRNCEDEKPELMVESVGIHPETGIPEDRVYLPYNEPKYHQVMIDMLKKQELVPQDATIESYDFLFEFHGMEIKATK